MDACTLKIYDISKLALSDYKEHKEKMNSVTSFFDTLFSFIKARTLINTKMSKSNLDVYCYDFKKIGSDYVIALWVGMSDSSGAGVTSLDKSSSIGSRPTRKKIGKNKIPGIPAYFYISSTQRKIVTIEFKGSSSDSSLITQYLRDFMHNYSKYADHEYSDDGKKSGGFKVKKKDDYFCYFSFELKRFINASVEKDLLLNYNYITNIITKSEIEVHSSAESSLFNIKPIMKLFSDQSDSSTIQTTVKMQVPAKFNTKNDLACYINEIKGTYDASRVGFVINTPSYRNTVYLTNTQAKEKVELSRNINNISDIPQWPYTASDIVRSLEVNNIIDHFILASSVTIEIPANDEITEDSKNVG